MKESGLAVADLLDLRYTLARPLLEGVRAPWEALAGLAQFIRTLGPQLAAAQYRMAAPEVWIAVDAQVAASASIAGPCIIGPGAQVRHCAFIRGGALIGAGAVVGNSTEIKNAILFDEVQAPHFNYVGDSILGRGAHLGAGAVTSNVKSDKTPVTVRDGEERIATGMKKLGAILGDWAEIGCNSVLCPGTVIGRGSIVYPTSCVRGVVPERHIYKGAGQVVAMRGEEKEG